MLNLLLLTQTWQVGEVQELGGAEGERIPEEAEGTPDVPQLKCMSDINCANIMHTAHLLTL